jgi:hypothetical protein
MEFLRHSVQVGTKLPAYGKKTHMSQRRKKESFLKKHSLSIFAVAVLLLWIVLYIISDPKTHTGAFFGNAIADWSGSVVLIIGTKFLIERGSKESKKKPPPRGGIVGLLYEHSLLIFLFVTGIGWALIFWRSDPSAKWGQVYGNILSEWVQMSGLVFFTKWLTERGSAESK